LNKKKDRGLGLSIVGKKSGPGVFISEVVKGGAADIDGRLVQGDQVTKNIAPAKFLVHFRICPEYMYTIKLHIVINKL
jgi:hypothetical protein